MDPRWTHITGDDGTPQKRLLPTRQPDVSKDVAGPDEGIPGLDFRVPQTEANRRREFEAAAAPAPLMAAAPAQEPLPPFFPPNPPTPTLGPDRLHKWAPLYVFVANDHNPGEDPVINPAFRSTTAVKSTINDAYFFARNTLAPKAKPGQRIIVLVIGGYYEEDIEILSSGLGAGPEEFDNIIDFQGMGKPIVRGEWRIAPSCGTITIDNFRMIQTTRDDLVLNIERRTDVRPQRFPGVQLKNLHVYGEENAVEINRQFFCEDSIFEQATFAPNNFAYTSANINIPLVTCRYVSSWKKWGVFRDCQFLGAATSNRLIKGTPLRVTSKLRDDLPGVAASYDRAWQTFNSGVILQHCRIDGWVENDCFRLGHQQCVIIGGSLYPPAAANTYLTQYSCSDPLQPGFGGGINSQTFFDTCDINSTFIAQCADRVVHGNGITSVYVRNVNHLGMNLGVPVNAVFDIAPNTSEVYATMSATGQAGFHVAPIVSLGNTVNIPSAATEDFYYDER